jgi:hypothetical protein
MVGYLARIEDSHGSIPRLPRRLGSFGKRCYEGNDRIERLRCIIGDNCSILKRRANSVEVFTDPGLSIPQIVYKQPQD